MVLTRSEAKVAYNHILDVVLGRGSGTPLKPSLDEEGIDDIFHLINLDTATIDSLSYTDKINNNAITNVRTGDKMLLKCFLNYTVTRHNEGDPIGDDWNQITQEEFDAF
jgi:hypothetical protein